MTRAPKKKKKNMKGRPRGGASVPCPECGSNTHVVITRRVDGAVTRQRKCPNDHLFGTIERSA